MLTVTGGLEGISKAYGIVAKGLLEGAPQMGMGGAISNNGTHRKFSPFTPAYNRRVYMKVFHCSAPVCHNITNSFS